MVRSCMHEDISTKMKFSVKKIVIYIIGHELLLASNIILYI
jgi:hypothetical protein